MYAELARKKKADTDREYYLKHKDKIKARTKEWRLKNPEQKRKLNAVYKKRNKAKVNENTRKYKQRNRGVTNANTAKRRAALLQRTPPWLSEQHVIEMKNLYTKAAEIAQQTGVEMHVDHIIPLQGENVSGLHVPWNLQILTGRENESKKNR
jgi:5-methylcytosine-specific restriction endonuclease McrA